MKSMTGMTFLAAVLLGVGTISSCSDSSIDADELTQGGETANVYANISVIVQDNESGGTRANSTLEGDPTDPGDAIEATVGSLNLYAFEVADNYAGVLKDIAENVTSSISSSGYDAANHVTYNSSVVFQSLETPASGETKTYRLYAIANPENFDLSGIEKGKTTEKDFLEGATLTFKSSNADCWIAYDGKTLLPMANRAFADSLANTTAYLEPFELMKVTSDNSSNNPATATIKMERLVAKYRISVDTKAQGAASSTLAVDLTENGATNGTKYATVTIDGYAPFNLSSSSYAIRHRSELGIGANKTQYWGVLGYFNVKDMNTSVSSSTNNWVNNAWKIADYVLDPKTKTKGIPANVAYDGNSGLSKYSWVHNGSDGVHGSKKTFKDIKSSDAIDIGYSFENITTADAQYMENSTGLIFRATLAPEVLYEKNSGTGDDPVVQSNTKPDSVYYYNYKFYINVDALYAANKNVLPALKNLTAPVSTTTGDNSGHTVTTYTYNNKEYKYDAGATSQTYNSVAEAKAAADKAYDEDIRANNKLLSDYGVTVYHKTGREGEDGKYFCYYPYIFKHNPLTASGLTTAQTTMSPMKFAVVRNNWYKVSVTGVQSIGRGTPEPDPYEPTPDEETEVWLKVNMEILDWVPRVDSGVTLK